MSQGDQQTDKLESVVDPRAVIRDVAEKVKKYYRLLLACLVVYALAALAFAALVQPQYLAVAVVGPAQTSLSQTMLASGLSGSGIAGLASKLSGLGSLANQGTPFSEYTQLLTSRRLTEDLAQRSDILPVVFYKKYDEDQKRWLPRDDVFHRTINFLKWLLHYPVKSVPDGDDLAKFLSQNMDVQTSLESEFVTVTLEFKDPAQSQELLTKILLDADRIIRSDTRADVSARLSYLESTLPKIDQADVKESLISILSIQQQQMMAINADKLFAFDLVDPPHADLVPSWPSLPLIGFLAIFFAIVTWGILVFVLRPGNWLLFEKKRQKEVRLSTGIG
jgi:hypothetical protein